MIGLLSVGAMVVGWIVWAAPVVAIPAAAVAFGDRAWVLRVSLPFALFHALHSALPKKIASRAFVAPAILAVCALPSLASPSLALLAPALRAYGVLVAWSAPLYALLEAYQVERGLSHASRRVIAWILDKDDERPRAALLAKVGVLAASALCYAGAAVALWSLYADPSKPPEPKVATAAGAAAALCAVVTVVAFVSGKGAITTSGAASLYSALAVRRGAVVCCAAAAAATKGPSAAAAAATTAKAAAAASAPKPFAGFVSWVFGRGSAAVQKAAETVSPQAAKRAAALTKSALSFDSAVSMALAVVTMALATTSHLSTEQHSSEDDDDDVVAEIDGSGAWQLAFRRALRLVRRMLVRPAAVVLFTNAVLASCGLEQSVGVGLRLLQVVVVLVLYAIRVLYPVPDDDSGVSLHED